MITFSMSIIYLFEGGSLKKNQQFHLYLNLTTVNMYLPKESILNFKQKYLISSVRKFF